MNNQIPSPRIASDAQAAPVVAKQTPDWRTLDFAADCLCVRSGTAPDRKAD